MQAEADLHKSPKYNQQFGCVASFSIVEGQEKEGEREKKKHSTTLCSSEGNGWMEMENSGRLSQFTVAT